MFDKVFKILSFIVVVCLNFRKALEEEMKLKKNKKLLGLFDLNADENEGIFGMTNLFTCMICSNPRNQEEKLQLAQIADSLNALNKKIRKYHL